MLTSAQTEGTNMLPKTIWMFWDQGESQAPEIVQHCINSWRINHPGWNVVVLDADSLEQYVTLGLPARKIQEIGRTKKSNLLRLELLHRYGGVWADATTLCCKPLESWMPDISMSGFFAFKNQASDRMLANWFLIAMPANPLIKALLDYHYAFFSRPEVGTISKKARKRVKLLAPLFSRSPRTTRFWLLRATTLLIRAYPYFVFHYMFSHLVMSQPKMRHIWDATPKLSPKAETVAGRLGLQADLTPEGKAALLSADPRMHKLRWKLNDSVECPHSVLRFVIDTWGVAGKAPKH